MAECLESRHYKESLLNERFFSGSLKNLLITLDRQGGLLISKDDAKSQTLTTRLFPAPALSQGGEKIASVSGAGDCFNSGFLMASLRGQTPQEALNFGSICALESLRVQEAVPSNLSNLCKHLITNSAINS